MNEKGWIKLHRQLQECPIWYGERFSKGQAWVDLLLLANHRDKKILFNGEMIVIKRGQYLTSTVKLAEKWGWNRKTVSSYLKVLENDKMIVKLSDKTKTLITIENYEVYQGADEEDEQPIGQVITQPNGQPIGHQKDNLLDINKNEKNEKNIIKPPLSPLEGEAKEKTSKTDYVQMIRDRQFDKSLEEVIIEWYRYKTEKRQSYKPTGFSKFLTEVQNNVMKYGVDAVIDVVNVSMANNWQGVTWDKLKNTSNQFKKSSSDVLSKYLNGGKQ